MEIVEKSHHIFCDISGAKSSEPLIASMGDTLLKNGKCILATMWHFRNDLGCECDPRHVAAANGTKN